MDPVPDRQPQATAVTRRAIVIGLLLVPLNVWWVIVAELRWYVVLTLNPIFVTPIFYLFCLVGANSLIRRFAPRLVFSAAEMVVIYVMLVVSCTIATHDFIINLMSTMGWAPWFANDTNRWQQTLFPALPRWLLVWDMTVLEGYFNGSSSLYDPKVLRAWLAPLGFWSIFIYDVGWMMLCMTVIVRRAWMDETRLSFPTVRLPLALTEEPGPQHILRSPAMWAGLAVAAGLALMNGLHQWFPLLPHFQTRALYLNITQPPWSAANPMWISWYPFGIGLAYLVPLDVSFSCWFFYLFFKAQAVAGHRMGYGSTPDMPFVHEQLIGAWYAFGISLLVLYRRYIWDILKTVWQRRPDAGDEPMPYRVAVVGLVIGMGIFFWFWVLAGMSPLWSLVCLFTYLLVSFAITRVRAEAGSQHNIWDLEPMNLMRLFNSESLGSANLGAASLSHWYWRLNRSHVMPSMFESFKLAQEQGIRMRSLVWPMLAAFALSSVVGMWSCLHIFYSQGALAKVQGFAAWTGWEQFNWLQSALDPGFKPEPARWAAAAGGAALTVALASIRTRFAGFPFHPLGYCVGAELRWLWFPFFIAWLAKLVIMRFGGLTNYRRALPFFLGLILGDYVAGALWSLVGAVFGIPAYQIFH